MLIWRKRLIGAFAVKRIDKNEGVTFVQDHTVRCPIKKANAATAYMKTALYIKTFNYKTFHNKTFYYVYYEWKKCNAQNGLEALEASAC